MEYAVAPAGFPVIALVCSAGGLVALTTVLERLPAELPAAVLIAQHMSPEYDSQLAEILDRRTALPVRTAVDGEPIAVGQVLVAPAGCHLLVTPQLRISLVVCGPFPPSRPSADLLLTTLAMAVGPRAIGVVLTGNGHDGATGATVIHHTGGLVLASDETTSEYFAMPRATITRDDAVDLIVPLEQIADRLVELTSLPLLGEPATPSLASTLSSSARPDDAGGPAPSRITA